MRSNAGQISGDENVNPPAPVHDTLAREFEDSMVIQNSESDSDESDDNPRSDSNSDDEAARRPASTHDSDDVQSPASHQANPTPAAAEQEVATDETSSSSFECADHGNDGSASQVHLLAEADPSSCASP